MVQAVAFIMQCYQMQAPPYWYVSLSDPLNIERYNYREMLTALEILSLEFK